MGEPVCELRFVGACAHGEVVLGCGGGESGVGCVGLSSGLRHFHAMEASLIFVQSCSFKAFAKNSWKALRVLGSGAQGAVKPALRPVPAGFLSGGRRRLTTLSRPVSALANFKPALRPVVPWRTSITDAQ